MKCVLLGGKSHHRIINLGRTVPHVHVPIIYDEIPTNGSPYAEQYDYIVTTTFLGYRVALYKFSGANCNGAKELRDFNDFKNLFEKIIQS